MNDFEFISNILKNITCSEVGKGGLTGRLGIGYKIKAKGKLKHFNYLVFQS